MTLSSQDPQNRHPSKAQAGGFFIFIGLVAGSVLGIAYDEPSVGMVGGFVVGAAMALVTWLIDRKKG
jgi:UDP-N-acetylmuramyl pentapeptide phosphotransferase/UDP-N-acetylglucosamine-1-phosphate transferase